MTLKDLIITPFFITTILIVALRVRSKFTDDVTRRYFIPALLIKMFGALLLGVVYQFYYSGGDTYNYWRHGSSHIWSAFMDNPSVGLKLIFANQIYTPENFEFASKIYFFFDDSAYFVIRLAGFFDLLTGNTYTATALFFSLISFVGSWLLFVTFYKLYPHIHKYLAYSIFFVPSVFFWGSGIMKDTICIGAIGFLIYSFWKIISFKRVWANSLLFALAFLVILKVKIYIILALIPALAIWAVMKFTRRMKSLLVRLFIIPALIATTVLFVPVIIDTISSSDKRYSLENVAHTAFITSYDLRYYTGRSAGSGYDIGEQDGKVSTLVTLIPNAINVTLFRPYLWEANNGLMLISAIESLVFLILTMRAIFKANLKSLRNPEFIFCLLFSLFFAAAIGIATYNFGSLVRYKIPILPFYLIALGIVSNRLSGKPDLSQ